MTGMDDGDGSCKLGAYDDSRVNGKPIKADRQQRPGGRALGDTFLWLK